MSKDLKQFFDVIGSYCITSFKMNILNRAQKIKVSPYYGQYLLELLQENPPTSDPSLNPKSESKT